MTERVEDLVRRLEDFGVPAAEGRLYFHLCRLGKARAAELAKESGAPRTEAYRLLDSLAERGYVEKTLERPARFVPVPVAEILDRAVRRKRRDLEDLADEQDALVRAWPQGVQTDSPDRRVGVHQGKQQIQGLLERLIGSAREDVTIYATLRGIATLDLERLMTRLKERRDAGLPVRFLTRVDLPDLPLLERLAAVANVRHLDVGEYHEMVIADTNQIALFAGGSRGRDPEGGKETLLSLTSPPFVMAQKALVDDAWNRGIDLAARIRELRDGEMPQRYELLRGRWMRTERLKQMLYRNDRLTIAAPAAEVHRWTATGVIRLLERRRDQGCRITVVTDDHVEAGGLTVHVVDARVDRLVATDGEREALLVDDCDDDGGPTNEAEWGVWTSVRSSVHHAHDHVRRLLDVAVPTRAAA